TSQPIEKIRVHIGQTIPARATTEAVFEGNLDAEAGVPVGHVVRLIETVSMGGVDRQVTLEFVKVSDTAWTVRALDENNDELWLRYGTDVYDPTSPARSEEHTSELQSRENLVC